MFIKRLKVEGFKMIGDSLKVDFPEGKKLIGIGGDEATGKSTLLESILVALFGLQYQHLEDHSNLITLGKEKAKIVVDFDIGNQLYRIQRIITKNGTESARLMRVSEGNVVYEDTVEGVTEVGKKVESLLGMEADIYSTFFYIRQGDLQVFSDLSESDKRHLITKAFGIGPFEQEIGMLIQDKNLLRNELQKVELQFERVNKNKQQYERRLAEKEELESALEETMPQLVSLKTEFEDAKSKVQNRTWHSIYDPLNNYLTSEIEKSAEISKQQDELFKKQEHLSRCEQILGKYRGEVERLDSLLETRSLKSVNNPEQEKSRSLHALRNDMIQISKSGTTIETLERRDTTKVKQAYLAIFLGLLATGIVFIAVSFFANATIFLVGMAALVASIFMSRLYDSVNKPLSSDIRLSSGNEATKISIQKPNGSMEVGKYPSFDSPEDIRSSLSKILTLMKSETGEESIEQLESSIVRLKREISELDLQQLQSKQDEVTRRITNLQKEISKLKKERDQQEKDDKLRLEHCSDEEQHLSLKTRFDKLNETVSDIKAVLQRVEQELKLLESDYDHFPMLENKLAELKEAILSLDKAEKTLSEASAELMNTGITVLAVMLNKVLAQQSFMRDRNIEIGDSLDLSLYSPKSGAFEPWKSLSQGVKKQIVFMLRLVLAHIVLNTLAQRDSSGPLLLDECILGGDERNEEIFRLLKAMEGTFSQIVIVTDDIKPSCCVDYVIKLTRNNRSFTMLRSVETRPKVFERDAQA